MQDQITKDVAKKLGIPEEQVKIVVSDFWRSLRDRLSVINKIGESVYLEKFLSIKIKKRRVERDLNTKTLPEELRTILSQVKENYNG